FRQFVTKIRDQHLFVKLSAMSTINQLRSNRAPNRAPWIGFLLGLASVGCNLLFFVHPPGERWLPWLSLLLAALALVFLLAGVGRAYFRAGLYRGKVSSVVFGVLTLALCELTVRATVQSKALPPHTDSPQV